MNTESTNANANKLANEMSKFKTVAAAQAWWRSLSPLQKGAVIGTIAGFGMGGYAFYATYKTVGVSTAIWTGIINGAVLGACTTSMAAAYCTPKELSRVNTAVADKF